MAFGSSDPDGQGSQPLVPQTYDLPELPWSLAGRLERTTIAVMQLEARLAASGLSAGWQSRCDMLEATRLILDGHFVDVADVVPHGAGMDVSSPTHELTRGCPPIPQFFPLCL